MDGLDGVAATRWPVVSSRGVGDTTIINSLVRQATNPVMTRGTIAIDLDDVLSATNAMVAVIHNELYGTNMTIDDFDYYLWWRNRSWGDIPQTVNKVQAVYDAGLFVRAQPVEGALEGCRNLREMGYRLIIVTARSEATRREDTEIWVEKYFPNLFDEIWFSGEFAAVHSRLESRSSKPSLELVPAIKTGKTKAEIIRQTNSILLIDDALEHAIDLGAETPPLYTILFGHYKWNKRTSRMATAEDKLSYDERRDKGMKMEPEYDFEQLKGLSQRAKDWQQVVGLLR